jgi:hypothetical protein
MQGAATRAKKPAPKQKPLADVVVGIEDEDHLEALGFLHELWPQIDADHRPDEGEMWEFARRGVKEARILVKRAEGLADEHPAS